jgi:hypothetical protein
LANPAIEVAQKLVTRRSFNRTGFPSVGSLDGGDERRFARGPAASPSTGAFAAEIGVVDLDPADQALGRITLEHDLLQLVFDLPGGGLRHPKATTQFDAGDALLGLSEMIDRTKPQPQRQVGRCKDRPGDRRSLPAALGALIEIAGRHQTILPAAAYRAFKATRPA